MTQSHGKFTNIKYKWFSFLIIVSIAMTFLTGCGGSSEPKDIPATGMETENIEENSESEDIAEEQLIENSFAVGRQQDETVPAEDEISDRNEESVDNSWKVFRINDVPAFSGNPYVAINDNIPYFDTDNLSTTSYEYYSDLDSFGRCGVTEACIGQDIMPTEERGEIGQVKPTGWQTVKYDNVDGKYLYNRCHLIGYQLTGENANEKNLITGTRYMNVDGMLPFENMVADYVKETDNHVMYQVVPVFENDNLLASGVIMEGWSVEDNGDGICFNVFVYNAQPDIVIDYASGDSYLDESLLASAEPEPQKQEQVEQTQPESTQIDAQNANLDAQSINPDIQSNDETNIQVPQEPAAVEQPAAPAPAGSDYILNTNTKKFHYPYCSSVDQMSEKNKQPYSGSRNDIIAMGYEPCKRCNP